MTLSNSSYRSSLPKVVLNQRDLDDRIEKVVFDRVIMPPERIEDRLRNHAFAMRNALAGRNNIFPLRSSKRSIQLMGTWFSHDPLAHLSDPTASYVAQ